MVGDAEDRPVRPDRAEFDPNKEYRTPNHTTTVRDGAGELEAIAYWILRDDLETLDPETGKKRGLRGENPILFEEHLYQRRRREILNKNGFPEPDLQSGLYWRAHPEGRKINSKEARDKGAGWFR